MSDASYDGIPNPNYDPDYGKRRTNAFAPTLRMDVDDEKFGAFSGDGVSIEVVAEQLAGFFRTANVSDGIRFTAESITVIETGQVLTNFQAGVAAIFEIDDIIHLKLNTGDVVAIEFYRV